MLQPTSPTIDDEGRALSPSHREVVRLLSLAVAFRLFWLWRVGALWQPRHFGEASNAAIALARTGGIVDSFVPGQGPTAHMLPTMILVAGAIHRIFGIESPLANFVLIAWAAAQMVLGFILLRAIFAALGQDRRTLYAGLLALALVPVFAPQEVGDFRYWEGGLTVVLASANLLWLLRIEQGATCDWRTLCGIAGLSAMTLFVNPAAGFAIDLCWAVFALRRLSLRHAAGFAMLSATALALLIAPWAMRNEHQFGRATLLRDDAGLEIAIANHADAVSGASPYETWQSRMVALHPIFRGPGLTAMRAAGGEYAYSAGLMTETRAWIATHPRAFARLCLRHYRQFYIPDLWELRTTEWDTFERARGFVMQAAGLIGTLGLILAVMRRRAGYGWIALYYGGVGLVYAVVQPVPRYTYLVFGLQIFLAAGLIRDTLVGLSRTRRADGRAPAILASAPRP